MQKSKRLKDFGRFLGYKLKQKIVLITMGLCSIPAILLFSVPVPFRLAYVVVAYCLGIVPILSATDLFVSSTLLSIQISLYNRKHPPQKIFNPRVKAIAERMGLRNYNKPIHKTDNPEVKSPFVNLGTGIITLPSNFQADYKLADIEVDATIGHELGHLKTKKIVVKELLAVSLGTMAISFVLNMITISGIAMIGEFAFMMFFLSRILRRNELRADMEGAKAVSPEALISVFQSFQARFKKDDGSDTHPSLHERISRLMPLLEEDNKEQSLQNLHSKNTLARNDSHSFFLMYAPAASKRCSISFPGVINIFFA